MGVGCLHVKGYEGPPAPGGEDLDEAFLGVWLAGCAAFDGHAALGECYFLIGLSVYGLLKPSTCWTYGLCEVTCSSDFWYVGESVESSEGNRKRYYTVDDEEPDRVNG